MANVVFKKGLVSKLPTTKAEGTLYITTDERAIYLDVDSSTRIRLGDFQEFDNVTALNANSNPSTTALYYVKDINCLAKWDGNKYTQINMDTGATSIEVVGDGNAVTAASYDPTSRKITLTKGATYATNGDITSAINALELETTYEKAGAAAAVKDELDPKITAAKTAADNAKAEADKKIASVTAGDNSITIAGTATAPTVAVKVDPKEGNSLKLTDAGLSVEVPSAAEYSIIKDNNPGEYAAIYHLTKNGVNTGAAINIPKDMVVQSGRVVKDPEGQGKGTYIELTLANSTSDKIYINVGDLIEYVTSGSSDSDMVVVAVSNDHKVTATITDGTITLDKFVTDVKNKINQAHTHTNSTELNKIKTGDVDKWNNAEQNAKEYADGLAGNYDPKGSADKALTDSKEYTDSKITESLTWGSF